MAAEQYYYFSADYAGIKNVFAVKGRYKLLQGAVLDDWQSDYTLVVYYQYNAAATPTEMDAEKCVYISFSNGRSHVIEIARTDYRNTAFYNWLTDLLSRDLADKHYNTTGNDQHAMLQTA